MLRGIRLLTLDLRCGTGPIGSALPVRRRSSASLTELTMGLAGNRDTLHFAVTGHRSVDAAAPVAVPAARGRM